jgi:hypothetical protein
MSVSERAEMGVDFQKEDIAAFPLLKHSIFTFSRE